MTTPAKSPTFSKSSSVSHEYERWRCWEITASDLIAASTILQLSQGLECCSTTLVLNQLGRLDSKLSQTGIVFSRRRGSSLRVWDGAASTSHAARPPFNVGGVNSGM